MKRFIELTNEEITQLSDTQIGFYLNLACAEAGVPLRPTAQISEAPAKPDINPDVTVYQVGSFSFLDYKEAEQLINILSTFKSCVDVGYSTIPGIGWVSDVVHDLSFDEFPPTIITRKKFSQAKYIETKDLRENYEREKERYETQRKKIDEWQDQVADATAYVMQRINDAREYQEKLHFFRKEYDVYLELAVGDKDIAWNFLLKAYPEVEDFKDSL